MRKWKHHVKGLNKMWRTFDLGKIDTLQFEDLKSKIHDRLLKEKSFENFLAMDDVLFAEDKKDFDCFLNNLYDYADAYRIWIDPS